MTVKQRVVLLAATGLGVGNLPVAPGTFGSVIALPLCVGLAQLKIGLATVVILCLAGLSVWIADVAEKQLQRKDPGCIVIDEIVGMVVALWGVAITSGHVIIGFLLFRAFDIWKPPPIKWVEQRLAGGAGVVADDVVAGIYSNITLRVIIELLEK